MATTYWYTGSRWRDYLYLTDPAGAPVTGDEANFTLSILGPSGNVATTGVTLTEPDAVNHPGTYEIEANPLTSFVATSGQYIIKAYNSTESLMYTEILNVTTNVIPTVFLTGASFVASSGDGRITDGSDPLSGAIVSVIDSTNTLVYQSQTDADGLWAAILDDGTYTISVFLNGYARATATLVMSGGTGSFGADIAMTLTSTSALLASQLFSYTRRQMGDNRGNKANAQIEESVNAALRMVSRDLNDHPWWQTDGTVVLRDDYTTGTIAVADESTTVELTDGTWPSWAASGEIYIEGTWYFITSRDSDTQITLSDAYLGDAVTAGTYQLAQVAYAWPDDLQSVGQTVFYESTWPYGAEPSDYEQIQRHKHLRQINPCHTWASHNNKLVIWPVPEKDLVARFLYRRAPALVDYDAPSTAVDMDPLLIDVVEAAIDVQLLRRGLYDGGENPRVSYEAAKKSAREAASKRASSQPSMGGSGRAIEPRLAWTRRG